VKFGQKSATIGLELHRNVVVKCIWKILVIYIASLGLGSAIAPTEARGRTMWR